MWVDKNGRPVGNKLRFNYRLIHNPREEDYLAAGCVWVEPPEPVEPTPEPKKYSKYKIILALGEEWPAYKAQMEASGVYDLFTNADYLLEGDPMFEAFIENVPEEKKEKLEECLWEE